MLKNKASFDAFFEALTFKLVRTVSKRMKQHRSPETPSKGCRQCSGTATFWQRRFSNTMWSSRNIHSKPSSNVGTPTRVSHNNQSPGFSTLGITLVDADAALVCQSEQFELHHFPVMIKRSQRVGYENLTPKLV